MIFNNPITLAETNDQQWELTAEDVRQLHALGWNAGELETLFQPAQIEMKAANPFHALAMGARSTKRVLAMTYITFLRLFEGTVKVSHLKGPVGITQIGSQMANQGFVYLLYFLALVSANLAVVNFLPIPIADGGHFVMLAYEGITKKPVPIAVQNALTMLGLILIGAVFLIVTMNDIRGLF
ncbi:MAG: site-2 protease family protein [Phycisphaerales bacterium]